MINTGPFHLPHEDADLQFGGSVKYIAPQFRIIPLPSGKIGIWAYHSPAAICDTPDEALTYLTETFQKTFAAYESERLARERQTNALRSLASGLKL